MNEAIKFLKKKHIHDIVTVSIALLVGWLIFLLPLMPILSNLFLRISIFLTLTVILAAALISAIPLIRVQEWPNALGLGSLFEMEKYFQNCECLDYSFFKSSFNKNLFFRNKTYLSDRYILDFRSGKIIPLSDIVSLKPGLVTVRTGRHTYEYESFYIINLKTSKRRKYRIFFDDENDRDKIIKRLSAYSDFAKGQKYID